VRFGGRTLTGMALADGTRSGFFPTPSLRFRQQRFTLSATDGVHNASVAVNVTKVLGDFTPSSGRPETLRAHFLVQGLGAVLDYLHRSPRGTVYAHYIRPNGKLKANRAIGSLSGGLRLAPDREDPAAALRERAGVLARVPRHEPDVQAARGSRGSSSGSPCERSSAGADRGGD